MNTQRASMLFPSLAVGLFLAFGSLQANAQTKQEVVLWESIKDTNLVGDFIAYLDAYPDGAFAPLAKSRLRELTRIKKINVILSSKRAELNNDGVTCFSKAPAPPSNTQFHSISDVVAYVELAVDGDSYNVEYSWTSPSGEQYKALGGKGWISDIKPPGQLMCWPLLPEGLNGQIKMEGLPVLAAEEPQKRGRWKFTVIVNRVEVSTSLFIVE